MNTPPGISFIKAHSTGFTPNAAAYLSILKIQTVGLPFPHLNAYNLAMVTVLCRCAPTIRKTT